MVAISKVSLVTLLMKAMETQNGIEVSFKTKGEAMNFRQQAYRIRKEQEKENGPLICLVFGVRQEGEKFIFWAKMEELDALEVKVLK